ncbi:hypothetical protein CFOL_v3_03990 [Cephalotus follicularis]|uniref:Protein GAMETE EXPRESSED 1 n=1 Tax=Cephalotus follicularis TaxID=3775 RepID=A0A1Q3AXN0_CEPFO|nr:hypothetical protein CFOL_v3_03990 [Cephalotus follicularis]
MGDYKIILLLLILVSLSPKGHSWGWFSSKDTHHSNDETKDISGGFVAQFSMEPYNDAKGLKRIENAKSKLVGSNSCWQNAYGHLFSGCSDIVAIEEKRSRFAWHLSDCFQKDSGRPPFPFCDANSPMVNCLQRLNDDDRQIYLEFLLETNSICHQLQTHAFKLETERLVNELKISAQYAEHKLETIEEKSDSLLQNSNQIHDSLGSIDLRVRNVAQTARDVENYMDILSTHSEAVYKQSREIATTQMELREGQLRMNGKLEEGMTILHDAYQNLGQEVNNLKTEAIEIEKEINKVGDTISSRMKNLQEKADDIGSKTVVSLDKQQQLLDGQSVALEGLQSLTNFQTEALEESRNTLQQLAEYGRKQQEELLKRQEQLQAVHDHLVESSNSILAAQEAFESKQASMFIVLDKLFALHNAMLLESRMIKAFFMYSMSIFIIYMFTSTKQTYSIRPRLYIGLCVTFLMEVAVLWLTTNTVEQQTWIINLVRSLFLLLASFQFLYAIFTYRDYELLNHNMLLTLIEKVNKMETNKALSWEEDSDINWSSWVDSELLEDEDNNKDPDYKIPEEVGENSITTSLITRKYNLRQRSRC